MQSQRVLTKLAAIVLSIGFVATVQAQAVIEIGPDTTSENGIWFAADIRGGGTASIVDLTGVGGNLELSMPSPSAAVLLTTGFDNGDKAEIGILGDFGLPQDILSSLSLSYSWFKATNAGQNLFAAPSIKLTFFNPLCDDVISAGDCYGTLIYEPTWNGAGATEAAPQSTAVPIDTWVTSSIDQNTGLFWWTGGFGQPNSFGGPPTRPLASWMTTFSSDFADATLVALSIGVGTYNQGQIVYFDNVQVLHSSGVGLNSLSDFELPVTELKPVPAMTSWSQILLVLVLLVTAGVFVRRFAN